jgi:hypothetical protein
MIGVALHYRNGNRRSSNSEYRPLHELLLQILQARDRKRAIQAQELLLVHLWIVVTAR